MHLMACNKKFRSVLTEEETKVHDNFHKDKDLFKFCNEIKLDNMYRTLMQKLHWDKDTNCAYVKEGDVLENDISFWIPRQNS